MTLVDPTLRRRERRVDLASRFGLVVVLVGVLAVFAVTQTDTFWTRPFFRNVGANESVLALASLAVMLPLVTGSIDGPVVMALPRVWYNPQVRSALFLVPGLIA